MVKNKKGFVCKLLLLALVLTLLPSFSAKAVSGTSVYKGIDYSAVYSCDYYSTHHSDLAALYGNNDKKYIEHFVVTGMKEGRQAKEDFDVFSYKRAYGDLRALYKDDLPSYYRHYMDIGRAEGRIYTTFVASLMEPIGSYAGIDLSPIYNFRQYLEFNPDLIERYHDDDVGALEHYIKYGIFEGRKATAKPNQSFIESFKKIAPVYGNEVTSYKGIDLSPVYDTAYYLWKNPDVAAFVEYDPVLARDHFVLSGMQEGRIAKLNFDKALYEQIKERTHSTGAIVNQMADIANGYSSDTNYIILVDKASKYVSVFCGQKGNYLLVNSFDCAIGANSSPTPSGIYKVGSKGLYFNTGTAGRCWYYTQIKGNYLFHSQIYDRSPSPVRLIDSRMGVAVSHGCIRLHIDNAKWIYDNVPSGSTIVVY